MNQLSDADAQENPGLMTLRSTDLLPSSWMVVAWYVILLQKEKHHRCSVDMSLIASLRTLKLLYMFSILSDLEIIQIFPSKSSLLECQKKNDNF